MAAKQESTTPGFDWSFGAKKGTKKGVQTDSRSQLRTHKETLEARKDRTDFRRERLNDIRQAMKIGREQEATADKVNDVSVNREYDRQSRGKAQQQAAKQQEKANRDKDKSQEKDSTLDRIRRYIENRNTTKKSFKKVEKVVGKMSKQQKRKLKDRTKGDAVLLKEKRVVSKMAESKLKDDNKRAKRGKSVHSDAVNKSKTAKNKKKNAKDAFKPKSNSKEARKQKAQKRQVESISKGINNRNVIKEAQKRLKVPEKSKTATKQQDKAAKTVENIDVRRVKKQADKEIAQTKKAEREIRKLDIDPKMKAMAANLVGKGKDKAVDASKDKKMSDRERLALARKLSRGNKDKKKDQPDRQQSKNKPAKSKVDRRVMEQHRAKQNQRTG